MAVTFQVCPSLNSFLKNLNPTTNSVLWLHVNIRSIRKYWDQFLIFVNNALRPSDVYVLTEINIGSQSTPQFSLPGYNSYFFTRPNGRGGGIAIYVKQEWTVSTLNLSFLHAETVTLRMSRKNTSIALWAFYRPPSDSVALFLDELSASLSRLSPDEQLCLVGDFNIDTSCSSKPHVFDYLSMLASFGIDHATHSPTREEHLGGKLVTSCLDHFNIRTPAASVTSAVILHKLADHYFIMCNMNISSSDEAPVCERRRITITDEGKFATLVNEYEWDSLLASKSHSDVYNDFVHLFTSFKKSSTRTIVVTKRRSNQPWLNSDILDAITYKELLWTRSKRQPNNDLLKVLFKSARNKVNALIRSAKRVHYNKKFSESRLNMAKTWSLVNELRGKDVGLSVDDKILRSFGPNISNTVNEFNNFFATSSGVANPNQGLELTLKDSQRESAFLPCVSESDLRSLLFSCKPKKSAGVDGIHRDELCKHFDKIKNVLLYIINGIIDSGEIPDGLKTAIVKPLFKAGSVENVTNYRPISILPCLAQLLEKHILHTMSSFLDEFNILSPCQYGFISGRGTQPLLEDFSDCLFSALETNQFVCALFVDVSKAFDTVCHNILLAKLYRIGFRGPFFALLKNYLSCRSQFVSVGGVSSSRVFLKAGVPQGSVLSPLLFNIYVNDLQSAIPRCKIFQYADDTVILSPHINFVDSLTTLQNDAVKMMDWFHSNLIEVNVSKTQLVCFRNPLKLANVKSTLVLHTSKCVLCNCETIGFVNNVKYLGVKFDSDLSWNSHLTDLCKRLRSVSCCLYNIRAFLPFSVRRMMAHSLAYSILRYGCTIFAHCSESWRTRIDSTLKNILKSVAYNAVDLSENNLFRALDMPSFHALFIETVVLRHCWNSEFKIPRSSCRTLRHVFPYDVPRYNTHYGHSMRRVYIPEIFNSLPESITQSSSKSHLRKVLRQFLLNNL